MQAFRRVLGAPNGGIRSGKYFGFKLPRVPFPRSLSYSGRILSSFIQSLDEALQIGGLFRRSPRYSEYVAFKASPADLVSNYDL